MSTTETSISFDLLLKGGQVIDPKNGRSQVMDVAVAGGRIAQVGRDLPAAQAKKVADVSGLYVTPGLIDMHVHVYPSHFDISVVADAHSFTGGITTMVDAGSAGGINFSDFKSRVIDKSRTRVLAYLNIVDLGMGGDFEQEVSRMDPVLAARVAEAYPELIVGIKSAHYWTRNPWDATHAPWASVEHAVEAGELCHKPVMVDFWPRPPQRPYADLILHKLRPGDIHTHVFAQQFPVIEGAGNGGEFGAGPPNPDSRINPVLFQAQKRGIIFDVGHGGGSFWFRNAVPAVRQGFIPHSISTDLHTGSIGGLNLGLLTTMSKFLNMGLTLEEVVQRATVAPAQEIGHPELGTLDVGAEADIAVLRLEYGHFGFVDCGRARMSGDRKLTCALTLRRGEPAYDPSGLTMPEWSSAPADYWICK